MATRLYFPATEAAPVSVAFAGWGYTSEALSRKLNRVKGSSAITIGTQIGPWTPGQNALDRQYVSDMMGSGNSFISGTTTARIQLMVREYANTDNVLDLRYSIRIVSADGGTVKASLTGITGGLFTEFINNVSHRNERPSVSAGITGSYTTVLGDRLVVEIGYLDNGGTTPEASAKWGENATDLTQGGSETTNGAGWIEFSNDISWADQKIVSINQAVKRASYW